MKKVSTLFGSIIFMLLGLIVALDARNTSPPGYKTIAAATPVFYNTPTEPIVDTVEIIKYDTMMVEVPHIVVTAQRQQRCVSNETTTDSIVILDSLQKRRPELIKIPVVLNINDTVVYNDTIIHQYVK